MQEGLRVEELGVRYARRAPAMISDLSFDVARGSTLAIVGPSGAGKTTLLRALAGLVPIAAGSIRLFGRAVEGLPSQRRRIALVFAEDALIEHRSVERNLRFVARNGSDVGEVSRAFAIANLLARRPRGLSTGERRRVSLARALLAQPHVLLLDEPLAVLDPELRAVVREELLHVRERFAGPMILVTHDHADAMTFAAQLAVLVNGRFEDIGDPQRVYDRPGSIRAASLLGVRPMSILPGRTFGETDDVKVGLRPERARLVREGGLRGTVVRREAVGSDAYVTVNIVSASIVVRIAARDRVEPGTEIGVAFDREDLRRFDARTGVALG